jgi:outer membrane biosynthesis protein TonB
LHAAGQSLESRAFHAPRTIGDPCFAYPILPECLKMNKLLSILFTSLFAFASTAAFAADEKKAEPKKEEAQKTEMKKEEAKKPDAKKAEAKPAAKKEEGKKKEETKKKEKKGGC